MMNRYRFAALAALCGCLAAVPATQPAKLAGQSHQIQNLAQANLLRPRDANSADGTPIVLYPAEDWRCMTWKLEPAGDDVRLVNYFTHKTFSPNGTAEHSPVTQRPAEKEVADAERWRLYEVGENVYRIEHVATGKTLAVNDDGNIVIETWQGTDTQKWKLLDKPAKFTG